MNSSKFTMTLDLHTSQSQYSISARLGDTDRKLLINLTDGGIPFKIPEGCSVRLSIKRPNSYFEDYCTIKGNTVIEYQFQKKTCIEVGIYNCDLTLYSLDDEVLGSPKFTMVVSDRVIKDDTDYTTESWSIVDAAALKETERQDEESKRVEAEAERQSKDAERDAKISEALDKSSVANTNASDALGFASSAYDTAQGAFNTSEQAFDNANEARRVAGEADTKSSNALSQATAAKSQSDSTRTSLINLSAQVQGIGRTYVIPTFGQFIDFLRDDFDIVLKEDRDGDGVDEIYRIKVNDLKSGDNIIITEKGVPDFWFEKNTALSQFETYTYEGFQYSLGSIVGGVVVGGAHILETDYTVIEGHALSAAASANEARGYAFDAGMAKTNAEVAASRAEKAVEEKGGALFSNALKGKKSGGIVAMNDISPLEHTLGVKAVGAVKVKKLGKNLLPFPYAEASQKKAGITFTVNADGSITLNGTWDGSGLAAGARITDFYLIKRSSSLKAGRYYLSSGLSGGSTYTYRLFGHIIRADGSQSYPVSESSGQYFDIKDGDTIALSIRIGDEIGAVNNLTVYPQIELGSVGTKYEPYIEPIEYAVNADGTVEGVTSIYPTTTLLTDTAGAVIDVEYNKDINKAFAELYNAIISLGGNV